MRPEEPSIRTQAAEPHNTDAQLDFGFSRTNGHAHTPEQLELLIGRAKEQIVEIVQLPDLDIRDVPPELPNQSIRLRKREKYRKQDHKDADWRAVLLDYDNGARGIYWFRNFLFWDGDESEYQAGLRDTFNTWDLESQKFHVLLEDLMKKADACADIFFRELFGENSEQERQYGLHPVIRETNDLRELLRIIFLPEHSTVSEERGKSSVPTTPSGLLKDRRMIRIRQLLAQIAPEDLQRVKHQACRKIALTLLVRSKSQDPSYLYRREDSDHFERVLLRDKLELIDPLTPYERVTIWFSVDTSGEVRYAFKKPSRGEWSEIELLKAKISGRIRRYSKEVGAVAAYFFPGNKNEIDAKDDPNPMLTKLDRARMADEPTIISYKSLEAVALKGLRRKTLDDIFRTTIMTETVDDQHLLESILDTRLASGVSSRSVGKSRTNGSTSHTYPEDARHAVHELHNEHAGPNGRNYRFEMRTGTFKLLIDRGGQGVEGSHEEYITGRALAYLTVLCPEELYPELHARGLEMAKRFFRNHPEKMAQLEIDGLAADFLAEQFLQAL